MMQNGPINLEPTAGTPATALVSLTAEEQRELLALARHSIRATVCGDRLPAVDRATLRERLRQPGACFVTLTRHGELRGCIGHLSATLPLAEAIIENAHSAALRDTRFLPITSDELDQLRIEISVLTNSQPLAFASPAELIQKLQPHVDGVILRIGSQSATFLPQVWEHLSEPELFLSRLAQKAGFSPSAWRERGVTVETYHVQSFVDEPGTSPSGDAENDGCER